MVGETNRAPFDLPEAEGELVGGFHTEYSSLKFAMFFLAEYINMITVSALATTLFLGGWRAPWPISTCGAGANTGWWPLLWFLAKVWLFMFVFIWLRGTLPRLRYDQFMTFGWKVLIPVSLVWIVVVATVARHRATSTARDLETSLAAASRWLLVVVAAFIVSCSTCVAERRRARRQRRGVRRRSPAATPCRRCPVSEFAVTRRAAATDPGASPSTPRSRRADGEEEPTHV